MLVFLAVLGDRTQFATVFLATAPGFGFAGLPAGTRLSEALLYRLSGGLFIVFGLVALQQALG